MKASVYNTKGDQVGEVTLPESVFGLKRNDALVKQVVFAMQSNARATVAHTKGRGDVRGGGRKPWKQKGTGRARHGSIRSPIWRGGGTTHGPLKEENYTKKINKKRRTRALAVVLSQKLKDKEVLFVDDLPLESPKTRNAKAALIGLSAVKGFDALATRRKNAALILTGGKSDAISKSFRNIGSVTVDETRNANPVDLLAYRFVVLVNPEKSVSTLLSRVEK
jgi:large subunit ribosomal protein L4